jgi:cytochrome c
MKKTLLGLLVVAGLVACGGGAGTDAAKGGEKDNTQDPAYIAGKELVAKSDCGTCHKPDEQFTGPSFKMIAAKYPYNVESFEMLSSKVLKGGTGVWGQIPMIPHPAISKEDATAMVKYILLNK